MLARVAKMTFDVIDGLNLEDRLFFFIILYMNLENNDKWLWELNEFGHPRVAARILCLIKTRNKTIKILLLLLFFKD